ncbi:MAG: hypothetical protein Q9199_005125 [Rusavskia elegans]
MLTNFKEDEIKYILYLRLGYTDTTVESLTKTFNYWFSRDLNEVAMQLLFEQLEEGPKTKWSKYFFAPQWALGSYNEGTNSRLRSMATYRMMYDLALVALGDPLPSHYTAKSMEVGVKLFVRLSELGPIEESELRDMGPRDLMELTRVRELHVKSNLDRIQAQLSKFDGIVEEERRRRRRGEELNL